MMTESRSKAARPSRTFRVASRVFSKMRDESYPVAWAAASAQEEYVPSNCALSSTRVMDEGARRERRPRATIGGHHCLASVLKVMHSAASGTWSPAPPDPITHRHFGYDTAYFGRADLSRS